MATPSRLPEKGLSTPIIFLAGKAKSAIKEISTLWMPPPAWWKKYKERGMIALRVQDPAARHEEALCLSGRPNSFFLAISRVFKTAGHY
jgi:hypothetical protein